MSEKGGTCGMGGTGERRTTGKTRETGAKKRRYGVRRAPEALRTLVAHVSLFARGLAPYA